MRSLWELVLVLLYRPYGSSLSTPLVTLWSLMAMLLGGAVATGEGWQWSNFALLNGASSATAWAIAGIVGAVMYGLDALIVLQRPAEDLAATPPERGAAVPTASVRAWFDRKVGWSLLVRMTLFAGSLYMSTFAVAPTLLRPEILASKERASEAYVNGVLEDRLYEARQADLAASKRLDEVEGEYTGELRGKNRPRSHGEGPVSAAIDAIRGKKQKAFDEAHATKSTLEGYRKLPLAARAKALKLELNDSLTMGAQFALADKLVADRSTGAATKLWVLKGVLALVFVSLMLMKVAAPPQVEVYLSQALQDARKGVNKEFAERFANVLGTTAEALLAMSPAQFAHWWRVEGVTLEARRAKKIAADEKEAFLKQQATAAEALAKAHREVTRAAQECTECVAAIQRFEEQRRDAVAKDSLEVLALDSCILNANRLLVVKQGALRNAESVASAAQKDMDMLCKKKARPKENDRTSEPQRNEGDGSVSEIGA